MKVFVSHASADLWVAKQIANELRRRSADVFIDAVDIETGDEFEERILEGLNDCDELLVLLSPSAVERPCIWMEIGAAWIRDIRIVGILHGMTVSDLLERDGTPALLKGIYLRDINDLDDYLEELARRTT